MGSGKCFGGRQCSFAHSRAELREMPDFEATELCCQFAKQGKCRKGNRCRFAHGEDKLRTAPKDVPPTRMKEAFAHPNQAFLEEPVQNSEMMMMVRAVQAAMGELKMLQVRLMMAEQVALELGSPGSPTHGFQLPPGLPPPSADSDHGEFTSTKGSWSYPREPVSIFL